MLGDGAVLKNITFDNVTYIITAGSRMNGASFGTLASNVSNQATFDNMTFNATLEIKNSSSLSLSESYNHTVGVMTGNGNVSSISGNVVCYFVNGEERTALTPDEDGMIDISELPSNQ